MKLKYYLRGLGVGIICTAIIMGIATAGNDKEKLTDAEIIERARILGMVMADENKESTKDADKEQIEQDEAAKKDTAKKDKTEEKKDEKQQEEKSKAEKQEPEKTETPQEPPKTEPELKTVEILPGDYSDVVSQKLFDAGLISDAASFNKYLTENGFDQNIMVGVHHIPMGANQEEIIRILGEKPE